LLELLSSGVPNLQFGSRKPGILPNCKFGTPDNLFVKSDTGFHKIHFLKRCSSEASATAKNLEE
jgi:hypothetical protein